MKIRIAGIEAESVVDGPGLRFVIFTQGCPHHCPGCHNPDTHDPAGGQEVDTERLKMQIADSRLIRGVTFSGGDPFLQPAPLVEIARYCHARRLNIVTYTGYTWEQLQEMSDKDAAVRALLSETDILIDSPFLETQRDISLSFRGSLNQRVIDVPASLSAGEILLWEDKNKLFFACCHF